MASKGSKVVTVPQLNPLCRLLVVLGTQGSWKFWGDDVGVRWVGRSRRGLRCRRGLVEEWEGLPRPGRRLRESERNGGGGGRLDLRREMLRVTEEEEEALSFLLSWFGKRGEVIFSEHTELLRQGVERPEESRGSTFQPSPEAHLISWVMVLQSLPVWLLWILELGERAW